MSLPLITGCLWVLVAAITALLPLRRQMWPGSALLVAAPVLLIWIGAVHGWVWVALGLSAFASMFRNPLIYIWKRARGQHVELPPEMRS